VIPLFKVFTDTDAALANLKTVLESGYVGQGKWCSVFEEHLRELTDRKLLYLNSGTSALQLAYHLAGVGPGTEVVSTPITCLATNTAIRSLGANIVWADVNPLTGNIDPTSAVRRITSNTRAIVGVDWGGRVCDFGTMRANSRGITLVEDAAHGLLSAGPERGDFIAYSFQAIKTLNTADGGGLACHSDATHERAKLLRWFGLDRTRSDAMRCYQPVHESGWKMQGNDVAAALGCANVAHAADLTTQQKKNATFLFDRLNLVPFVTLPPFDYGSAYWLFTILVSSPAKFEAFAAKHGVMASQVHARNDLYACFSGSRNGQLPGVDFFAAHQINIPVGWWLSEADVVQVVQVVKDWASTPEARWSMEPP
jgi:dTDP-4-amino-4,6-dideoxygalactose transaminase